jgi:VacB/RNase II family 3'-5' exoribonuclease
LMNDAGHRLVHFDLPARAREEMRNEGFEPEFPPAAVSQIQQTAATVVPDDGLRDQRGLLWSSIDNRESRDLDQIEIAEQLANGVIRLRIGIADVDALVPGNSPIDRHAAHNCCSVYTGVVIFPLLPEEFSNDRTSLLQDRERTAVVVEMDIDEDGGIAASMVYRALTRNCAQLAYEDVGRWIEGEAVVPERAARVKGLEAQMRLQHEAARRLLARRQREGALEFESVEPRPVVEDGRITDLSVPRKNAARIMIENFMISANVTMARFLEQRGIASIQRVVRSPQRWPRIIELAARYGEALPAEADPIALSQFLAKRRKVDPERFVDLSLSIVKLMGPGEYTVVTSPQEHIGHFGLAVYSYTHSTAPNRRYADLIVQRALKATLAGAPQPYSEAELAAIADRCTERENAARKVERFMRKAVAAVWLRDRIGETFDAIVTGAAPKGTYVRLLKPPVEGRVLRGEHGLDVGDHTRVRLIGTDPERGFIDFERAP